MLYYLKDFNETLSILRLFEYVTFRAGGAAFTSFFICFVLGPLTIKMLKQFRATAPCRLKGLVAKEFIDEDKNKTPSMGGILIVISIIISTLLWANPFNPLVQAALFTLGSLALLGFIDDYIKIAYKNRDGISGKVKLISQCIIACIAVCFLYAIPESSVYIKKLMLPFTKYPIEIGIYGIIIAFGLAVLTIVASSNAVNLTDGKDGLATGCVIISGITYALFAYFCGHEIFSEYLNIPFIPRSSETVIFIAALIGAAIGFLWYNCFPASMFMGDTGSLALGGSIGLIAVLVRQELILFVVGGVFVMEAASVIIQVVSFKLTGKRIFICTPIHHHFEQKKGPWSETQIVVRFWILSAIFAIIGLASLKLR